MNDDENLDISEVTRSSCREKFERTLDNVDKWPDDVKSLLKLIWKISETNAFIAFTLVYDIKNIRPQRTYLYNTEKSKHELTPFNILAHHKEYLNRCGFIVKYKDITDKNDLLASIGRARVIIRWF